MQGRSYRFTRSYGGSYLCPLDTGKKMVARISAVFMFIKKQPCQLPRVLSEGLCPPHNEPHLPSEYPHFYNALYYPDLHPEVFSTHEGVSEWIKTMMVTELGPLLPFLNITVTHINDCFTVELDGADSIPFSANNICDAKFSVWKIGRAHV